MTTGGDMPRPVRTFWNTFDRGFTNTRIATHSQSILVVPLSISINDFLSFLSHGIEADRRASLA
jgi:hypothetical protein